MRFGDCWFLIGLRGIHGTWNSEYQKYVVLPRYKCSLMRYNVIVVMAENRAEELCCFLFHLLVLILVCLNTHSLY